MAEGSEMLELLGQNTLYWVDSFAKHLFEDSHKLDSFDNQHDNDAFLPELHLAAPLVDSQHLLKFDAIASFDHRPLEFDSLDHAYQHSDLDQSSSPPAISPATSPTISTITSYNHAAMLEGIAAHTTSSIGMTAATSVIAYPCIWAGTGHRHIEQGMKMNSSSTCTSYNPLQMLEDATHTNSYTNIDTTRGGTTTHHPCIWADKATCPPIPMEQKLLYHAAAMQPIELSSSGENMLAKKTRRNIRISKDPQSMAARQRRQRVSEKMRVLQRLVPGGAKLDTATMLEEAAHYIKFLKAEVEKMEAVEEWMSLRAAGSMCTHKFKEILPLLADDASDESPPSITSVPFKGARHLASATFHCK